MIRFRGNRIPIGIRKKLHRQITEFGSLNFPTKNEKRGICVIFVHSMLWW